MKWQKNILTIKFLNMTENFNRTIVFDFSKMSEEDIKRAREIFGGVLKEIPDEMFEKRKKILTYEDVLSLLMHTMNLSRAGLRDLFSKLDAVTPGATYNLILRTIALEMDKRHSNHISEQEYIYIISLLDGKVHKQATYNISKKSYKYFAAFRTQEDAINAIKLAYAVKNALSLFE
jgi:hypothetical protein